MSVNEALSAGFARASHRPGAVFLDLLWKAIWLALTFGLLLVLFLWFYSESHSIQLEIPANPLQSPLLLVALGRELWAAYAARIFWFCLSACTLSTAAWVLLEAYFRAGIVPASVESFGRTASHHFKIFLTSAIAKILLIGSVTAVLALTVFSPYLRTPVAEWRSLLAGTVAPLIVALLLIKALWFVVLLLDTLIRSDSLDLLGREIFSVAGIVATLVMFEWMIVVSCIAGIVVLGMVLSGPAGLLLTLAAAVCAAILLCFVHSYLLLVRFSSIAFLGNPFS